MSSRVLQWYRVPQVPDLTLNKYQSLAETGVGGVLSRHTSFLRQWHGICLEAQASLHLLNLFLPNEQPGNRLHLYLGVNAPDDMTDELNILLRVSSFGAFYAFEPATLPNLGFASGSTLTKRERIAEIYDPLAAALRTVHYVPELTVNEQGRLYDLWKAMEACSEASGLHAPLGYRIDLYPSSDAVVTHEAFSPVLRLLRGQQGIKLTDNAEDIKRDDMAKRVCDVMDDWMESMGTTPCFRANMYSFAPSSFLSKVLLNAVGAEAVSSGDLSIVPIRCDASGYLCPTSRLDEVARTYCSFPQQAVLNSWPTTYTLEEICPFFRLPALYDGESIETPKETQAPSHTAGLPLGVDLNGHAAAIDLKSLPKHGFFTGMPGSGKTNTMLHLATELHKRGIPFLALEPSKKEYRSLLLRSDMDDLYLFSPHLRSCFPLRVNPLEFPRGVRLSEHLDALLEVFEGSFLLQGPTRMFLSRALQRAYERCGWQVEDVNDGTDEREYPTMSDVRRFLRYEIEASSYNAELKGDLFSFLEVRLGGLLERDAGEVFDTHVSTILPEDWLKVSAVIELEVLGSQATNFLVLLLCHYIFEGLRADSRGGLDENGELKPVRHAIFIEEAHNLIAPTTEQAGSDTVDPKISATAYIVKMLAEVRALREAVFIADQLPTALAPEVTKNTGLKVVHRLGSSDDREQVGTAISASALQLEQMATLSVGQAFVFHEQTQRPFLVKMALWEQPDKSEGATNDSELFALCQTRAPQQVALRFALEALLWGEVSDLMNTCALSAKTLQAELRSGGRDKQALEKLKAQVSGIASLSKRLKTKVEALGDEWHLRQSASDDLRDVFEQLVKQIAQLDEMSAVQVRLASGV